MAVNSTLAWSGAVVVLLARMTSASTIIVDSPADPGDAATCALRDAIAAANDDTAVAGCAAGSGDDTIIFGSAVRFRGIAVSAELVISSDVTIVGPGATSLSLNGTDTRVFRVAAGGRATLTDLTIAGGHEASDSGGGIQIDAGGSVVLTDSVLLNNQALIGGGIHNSGTASLTNCQLVSNEARYRGGAIANENMLVMSGCWLADNRASLGGAIANTGRAALGDPPRATAMLSNCAFTANTIGNSAERGGAIANLDFLTLTNCTLYGNRASEYGSGLHIEGAGPPGETRLQNTLIAGDSTIGDCAEINAFAGTMVVDLGHNLIGDPIHNCGLVNGDNGDIVGTDAGVALIPIFDDQGLGMRLPALCTAAGVPGEACTGPSPARDAGDNNGCTSVDQRGVRRALTSNDPCDIGAYEYRCTGDCDRGGLVTINELTTMVNQALGSFATTACLAGDANADNQVSVDEILAAVNNALNGCIPSNVGEDASG